MAASPRNVWSLPLLAAFVVCGAGASHAGRVARYGGNLQVELSVRPVDLGGLDPLLLWGDEGNLVGANLFEGLTLWGNSRIEPGLAVHWVSSDDDTRWLFQLRADARFHDGARCDAQSVSESLHRLADPRLSRHAWLLRDLVGIDDFATGETAQIEGIYVLSASEIELQFVRPVHDVAARLALPEAAIARHQATAAVGTGSFSVVAATPDTLRCAAFDRHYEGLPFLATLAVLAAPSATTRARDAMDLRRIDPVARPAAGSIRVHVGARRLGLALIHPASPAFADAALRALVASEFDAAVFVRAGLNGDGEPALGLYPDTATLRSATGAEARTPHKESGRRSVKILVPTTDAVLIKLGERLQVQLSRHALDVEVESRPPGTYATTLREGRYDIAILGWTPPQGHVEDLQESARVLHVLGNLLAPALGDRLLPAWGDLLAGRARATEAALMASGHLVPLVFFHDAWEAPDVAQALVPATGAPRLNLGDVHLQASGP